jgi:hypothetical protein
MPNKPSNQKVLFLIGAVGVISLLALRANPQQATVTQPLTYLTLKSSNVCSALGTGSSPATASCGASPAGAVANPAGSTSLTVSTSAVTTSSQIFIQYDESVSISGVTCNVTSTARQARYLILTAAGRSSGSSFTITPSAVPASGNPVCLSYFIVN